MTVKLLYFSADGFIKHGKFRNVNEARAFAHQWVGPSPICFGCSLRDDFGDYYAISKDGSRLTVEGATLADLFPPTSITKIADPSRMGTRGLGASMESKAFWLELCIALIGFAPVVMAMFVIIFLL